MKSILFLFLGIIVGVFSACNSNKKSETPIELGTEQVENPNFDYLLGEWIRTNEDPGKLTYEKWVKVNDTLYMGVGSTISNNDTIWQEKMELTTFQKIWTFRVLPNQDTIPTDFILTAKNDSSFTCENPENEFPKTIHYWSAKHLLIAEISDGSNSVMYNFQKK